MGKYLELLNRAALQRGRDISDQSDKSPPRHDRATHFSRLCRFGRGPEPTGSAVTWSDAQEERAAIAEHDGGAPRAWAEAFARLDPTTPPGDVPASRWVQFIDDCGRFLDDGWASRVEALGWRPLDLFGCDRERLFAGVEPAGLLWCLEGGKLLALTADTAVIETSTGHRQTCQRRPVEVGCVVLAWEVAQ